MGCAWGFWVADDAAVVVATVAATVEATTVAATVKKE